MNSALPLTTVNRQSYNEAPNVRGLSSRDGRLVGKQWLKSRTEQVQNESVSRVLAKMKQDLTRVKHRVITPPLDQTAVRPFDFYNCTPNTSYAINNGGTGYSTGDNLTLQGGTLAPGSSPTTFTIGTEFSTGVSGIVTGFDVTNQGVYTTPPTWPATVSGGSGSGLTVTQISSADAYRTCAMRAGGIGLRSRYFPIEPPDETFDFGSFCEGMGNVVMDVGNYQYVFCVYGDGLQSFAADTDIADNSTTIMLGAAGTPQLICGIDKASGDFLSYNQIVINTGLTGTVQAAFWLEIIDDPTSIYTSVYPNLMGQMYDYTAGTAFPYPSANVNIIPIAIVGMGNANSEMFIEQFLSGNLINLFDAYFNNNRAVAGGPSGLAVGSKTFFRGDWTGDSLSGQYFYPGDLVRDVQPGLNPPGFNYLVKSTYVCMTYLAAATTNPAADTTNWLPLAY